MATKKFKDGSKAILVKLMRKEVTNLMEKALDFSHVACPRDNFQQLRSKILRVGNDCMRSLEKEFDNFEVEYTKLSEEVIEFNK